MAVNLLDYDLSGLSAYCETLGEKRFRAMQLFRWIHQRGVAKFDEMTDLAKPFREKLKQNATISTPPLLSQSISNDGTIKWLFDVGNLNAIETVFIPELNRGTLCISSQAGCAIGCKFCSTGHQGFNRNLTKSEIIAQLWFAEHFLRSYFNIKTRVISNVVMMGMGEPLQNYSALVPILNIMLDDHAYGLSRRRVTVSTSGIVPMIDRLRVDCPVALAVSLHAPTDELRTSLVPINKKFPIDDLFKVCKKYLENSPRDFITFEYCLLDGINDSKVNAIALVELIKKYDIRCKINLIPFNPFPQSGFKCSPQKIIDEFSEILTFNKIITTIRKTRGNDIDAACGQLAGDIRDRTKFEHRMKRINV